MTEDRLDIYIHDQKLLHEPACLRDDRSGLVDDEASTVEHEFVLTPN